MEALGVFWHHPRQRKKMHNLKDESCVLLGGPTWGLKPRIAEETVPKRKEGMQAFAAMPDSWNRSLLFIKENQISQAKEFSIFL